MKTGIPRPLARHPHLMARGLASLGRGGDNTLVHMSHKEVAGLQNLARAHGKSLTVNPHTGLPEAKSLLEELAPAIPTLAGAAMGYYLPEYSGLAALGYGTTALALGADLPSAINAGMQFYGGEGLGSGVKDAFKSAGTTGTAGTTGAAESARPQSEAIRESLEADSTSPTSYASATPPSTISFGAAASPTYGIPADNYASQLTEGAGGVPDSTVDDPQFGLHHTPQGSVDYAPSKWDKLKTSVAGYAAPLERGVESLETTWKKLTPLQKAGLTMAGTNILESAGRSRGAPATPQAKYYVPSTNQPLYSRKVNPDFLRGVPGAAPYIVSTGPGEYTTDASRVSRYKAGGGIKALAEGGVPEQNNPVQMPQNQSKTPADDDSAWTHWTGGSYNPNADSGGNQAVAALAYAQKHPELQQQAIDYGLNTWFGGNAPQFMPWAPKQWDDYSNPEKIAYIGSTIPQYANNNRILQQQENSRIDTGDWNDPIGDAARGSSALWADTAYDPGVKTGVYNPSYTGVTTQKLGKTGVYNPSYTEVTTQKLGKTGDPTGAAERVMQQADLQDGGMGGDDYLKASDFAQRSPYATPFYNQPTTPLTEQYPNALQLAPYTPNAMGGNFLGDIDFSQRNPKPSLPTVTMPGGDDYLKAAVSASRSPYATPFYNQPTTSLTEQYPNALQLAPYTPNTWERFSDWVGDKWRHSPQLVKDLILGAGDVASGVIGGLPGYVAWQGARAVSGVNNDPNAGRVENFFRNTGVGSAVNPTETRLLTDLFHSGKSALTKYLNDHPASTTQAQPQTFAAGGGIPGGLGGLNTYAAGGKLLRGPGDGMSDSIPAVIGGHRPQRAALADGEFVIPADVVSHLGNGSTEAGSRKLYQMMDKVRQARTGRKHQAPKVNADKFLVR